MITPAAFIQHILFRAAQSSLKWNEDREGSEVMGWCSGKIQGKINNGISSTVQVYGMLHWHFSFHLLSLIWACNSLHTVFLDCVKRRTATGRKYFSLMLQSLHDYRGKLTRTSTELSGKFSSNTGTVKARSVSVISAIHG